MRTLIIFCLDIETDHYLIQEEKFCANTLGFKCQMLLCRIRERLQLQDG